MKKIVLMIMTSVFVLSGSMTALAANENHGIYCHEYVDADNSGTCDYGDIHHEYCDTDNSGTCDYGDIHCTQYVDTNGDGLCDNCPFDTAHQDNSNHGEHKMANTTTTINSGNSSNHNSNGHSSSEHKSHGGKHH